MGPAAATNPPPPPAAPPSLVGGAVTAAEALRTNFDYWTGKLTETSVQLSYAVLGANWAVFGKVDTILRSNWSKMWILCVVASLSSTVIGAKIMGERHRRRLDYADEDTGRWEKEFQATKNRRDPWPYTLQIESRGAKLRFAKTWLPFLAGPLFFVALLRA
jgi:hypothetical protein